MANILLIEDNDGFRNVIRNHITRTLNYNCEAASSYTEAMAILHDRPFHVVVCDISLRTQNGLEILAHIKSTYPSTEVIMISAIADRVTRDGTLKLGAAKFLAKPFELRELQQAIEEALSIQRAAA